MAGNDPRRAGAAALSREHLIFHVYTAWREIF
jgi:hypothetical protein